MGNNKAFINNNGFALNASVTIVDENSHVINSNITMPFSTQLECEQTIEQLVSLYSCDTIVIEDKIRRPYTYDFKSHHVNLIIL